MIKQVSLHLFHIFQNAYENVQNKFHLVNVSLKKTCQHHWEWRIWPTANRPWRVWWIVRFSIILPVEISPILNRHWLHRLSRSVIDQVQHILDILPNHQRQRLLVKKTNATYLSGPLGSSIKTTILLPTLMITDCDRLQTDIIELDEYEPEKEWQRARPELRSLLNDRMPQAVRWSNDNTRLFSSFNKSSEEERQRKRTKRNQMTNEKVICFCSCCLGDSIGKVDGCRVYWRLLRRLKISALEREEENKV